MAAACVLRCFHLRSPVLRLGRSSFPTRLRPAEPAPERRQRENTFPFPSRTTQGPASTLSLPALRQPRPPRRREGAGGAAVPPLPEEEGEVCRRCYSPAAAGTRCRAVAGGAFCPVPATMSGGSSRQRARPSWHSTFSRFFTRSPPGEAAAGANRYVRDKT